MAYKLDQLKEFHMQKIRDCFYQEKICKKNQLSEETGISKTTCTSILKELEDEGFIRQIEDGASTGGRPSKQYQLNQDYGHSCLVSLKAGKLVEMKAQVRNLYGEVLQESQKSVRKFSMKYLCELLESLFEQDQKITAIAVSIPGVVDQHNNVVFCDILGLEHRNIRILLETMYDVEVTIENDVNLAVVGYHSTEDSLAFLYQPPVMFSGCGLIIDGRLYRGHSLFAGEVGYLKGCVKKEPKNREDAKDILLYQISALTSVLNPEKIVYYSCYDIDALELFRELKEWVPIQHIPELEHVDELDRYIFEGLMEASIDMQRNHIVMKEVRKV